ncbi:MAG: hypothetical protein IJ242_06205 [Clostridia bacterium]|nr:hypothetical protein [Clostridia bacterium]
MKKKSHVKTIHKMPNLGDLSKKSAEWERHFYSQSTSFEKKKASVCADEIGITWMTGTMDWLIAVFHDLRYHYPELLG